MSTVGEIRTALALGIKTALCDSVNPVIPELQVTRLQNPNPTPPSVDIYPGDDPYTEQVAFGPGNREYNLTVRVRIQTSDNEAGQDLLDAMMDDGTPQSMETAIFTVSGVKRVVGPSPYRAFRDVGGQAEWLGCTWRVTFIP